MIVYVGYLAGFLTVTSFLPQVLRAWRTRTTRDLSPFMVALLIISGSLWLGYGIIIHDWPVILTNVGMVAMNVMIAAAKARYG